MVYDWEGVSSRFTVARANWVQASFRFNGGDGRATTHRVYITDQGGNYAEAILFINSQVSNYLVAGNLNASTTATITLTNNISPPYWGADGGGGYVALVALTTDGTFVQPPPSNTRRMEFVGDSITASCATNGSLLMFAYKAVTHSITVLRSSFAV